MNKLGKIALGIIGANLAATSVVAVQNAIVENGEADINHRKGLYEKYVKRPQDFFFASVAMVALSPLLTGTAIAVRLKLGSPVLFTQERPGKDEKLFKLYKFRTMSNKRDANGVLLSDAARLTKFGRILRSTSLDEIPELINILSGDMSFVGPRPLMERYLSFYTDEERKRHRVRPGLTGYAQVHGRNTVSWGDRINQDLYYVDHLSLILDIKIIIRTIMTVIKREGTSNDNMENFDDYRKRQWEMEKR